MPAPAMIPKSVTAARLDRKVTPWTAPIRLPPKRAALPTERPPRTRHGQAALSAICLATPTAIRRDGAMKSPPMKAILLAASPSRPPSKPPIIPGADMIRRMSTHKAQAPARSSPRQDQPGHRVFAVSPWSSAASSAVRLSDPDLISSASKRKAASAVPPPELDGAAPEPPAMPTVYALAGPVAQRRKRLIGPQVLVIFASGGRPIGDCRPRRGHAALLVATAEAVTKKRRV